MGVRAVAVAFVLTGDDAIKLKKPKLVHETLEPVTTLYNTIREVKQLERNRLEWKSPDLG